MAQCDLLFAEEDAIPVFRSIGYFNEDTGKKLSEQVDVLLSQKRFQMIIDFSGCDFANSLGIAALLTLLLKVCEDFKGTVVLTGMNPLLSHVFDFANFFRWASPQPDVAKGIAFLKSLA